MELLSSSNPMLLTRTQKISILALTLFTTLLPLVPANFQRQKISQQNLQADVPSSQVGQIPVSYYYFGLLPGIITAVTPLILGLRKKNKD
jgi:hypothetical protein